MQYMYIYNGILLSHKKNEISSLEATWIDLMIIILNEVSQTEKDKYYTISCVTGSLCCTQKLYNTANQLKSLKKEKQKMFK